MELPSSSRSCPFLQSVADPSTSQPFPINSSESSLPLPCINDSSSSTTTTTSNTNSTSSSSSSGSFLTNTPSDDGASSGAEASTSSAARAAAAGARMPRTPSGTYQSWNLQRPQCDQGRLRLTRRELRRSGGNWTLEEVAKHNTVCDAWIAVNGRVYDITEHLVNHPGWEGAGVSTVLSIVAHLGMDCSQEFAEIHRPWPVAWRQLAAFDIGGLEA